MVDIMPRLKSETREEHTATERTTLARAMLHGTMTVAEYKAQLAAYHSVHEAIDRRLAALPFASEIAGPSAKAARLSSDLVALAEIAGPSGCGQDEATRALVALVEEADAASLLGIVYVMEGSSLGAAILYPRIKEALALPAEALTYYLGDGSATLDRWKAFGARMNATLVDSDDQERALTSARATFVAIRRLFEEIRPAVEVATDRNRAASCGGPRA